MHIGYGFVLIHLFQSPRSPRNSPCYSPETLPLFNVIALTYKVIQSDHLANINTLSNFCLLV